jgi:structural maintenance of chromosome 3 (chondroitin sulfate proteoglycan 6)
MSAYVEVCFDNTEDRFQTGKPEFYLRRTIGAKKDEYSVNRKNATKAEVIQILESAGFSRSNPYYIVPQGRVTALTNMKDKARLEMLKEISGSNVYETRRADSLKLLNDTDSKCANIDSVVESINERLGELEGEKEELEAWSKNDRERRSLLYTLHSREEAELEAKIEHIDSLEHHGREMREDNEATFRQNEDDITRLESEINQRKGDLDILRQDRVQYEGERKAATLEKAKIELDLKALQDSQSSAQQTKSRRDAQIKALQQQIRARQVELEQLLPQFNAKKEEEEAVRAQLLDAEGQYKRLQDKQGRTAHYSNKRERDTALRAQIDETNGDLSRRKAVLMQTNEEITELQNDIERIEGEIAELRQAIDNEGDAAVDLAAQLEKAKDAKKAVVDKQTNLWREQNRLSSQLGNVQKDLHHAEQTFSRLLDHGTSRGLESLRRYRRDGLQGVHGTIAELLQVPENYRSVTESAAEAALFHVVVEDDEVATKVMDRLTKDKGGRLTFIPLNRISVPDIQLRPTENMQPLLPKLVYDDRFEDAFRHVFGKIVVCPTLDECKRVAKQYNVRAYNPDGDNATRKGQYRGGFHDPSRSKINAFSVVAEKRAQLDELQQRNRQIEEELESVRHQLTAAQSELLRRQNDQRRGETSYAPMREEVRVKQGLLQDTRDTLAKKQRTAADLEAAINLLGAQQSDWEAEIASKFTKALSNDEEQMLVTLTSTVKDLKKQYAQVKQERATLETQKIEAELEVNQSLQPALDDLLAQQGGAGGSGAQSTGLREAKRALDTINKTIANLDQQIEETDTQIDEIRAQIEQLESSRNEKEQSNRALAAAMEKQEKLLSRKDADRSTYTSQLNRCRKEIRDLGTLPEDVGRKYSKWNTEKVGLNGKHLMVSANDGDRSAESSPKLPKQGSSSHTSTKRLTSNTRTSPVSVKPSQTAAPNSTPPANRSKTSSTCSTSAKTKPLPVPSSRSQPPSRASSRNSFPSAPAALSSTADQTAHKMTTAKRKIHNNSRRGRKEARSRNTSASASPYPSTRSTTSSRRSASYLAVRNRFVHWHSSSLSSSAIPRRSTSSTRSMQTSMHSTALLLRICCRSLADRVVRMARVADSLFARHSGRRWYLWPIGAMVSHTRTRQVVSMLWIGRMRWVSSRACRSEQATSKWRASLYFVRSIVRWTAICSQVLHCVACKLAGVL